MLSDSIRQWVRQRAKYLCEYCHSLEEASAAQFEIDHIVPRSRGGKDDLDNLALACQRCNSYRYNFVQGWDAMIQADVPLFNPRQQRWSDHFSWDRDGLRILCTTSTGRGTCERLDLNDDFHNDGAIIKARKLWIRGGWHPPDDDPMEIGFKN